jgi:hypothetical protein
MKHLDTSPVTLRWDEQHENVKGKPHEHLQVWIRENNVDDNMVFKNAFSRQVCFFRDAFDGLLRDYVQKIEVISTHTSKSILLPVYRFVFADMEMIVRDNFHNIIVTIVSDEKITIPDDLIRSSVDISAVFCEGFDESWALPHYSKDNRKNFTVEFRNLDELRIFAYLLKHELSGTGTFVERRV